LVGHRRRAGEKRYNEQNLGDRAGLLHLGPPGSGLSSTGDRRWR
jgi:hypothetical protein